MSKIISTMAEFLICTAFRRLLLFALSVSALIVGLSGDPILGIVMALPGIFVLGYGLLLIFAVLYIYFSSKGPLRW